MHKLFNRRKTITLDRLNLGRKNEVPRIYVFPDYIRIRELIFEAVLFVYM